MDMLTNVKQTKYVQVTEGNLVRQSERDELLIIAGCLIANGVQARQSEA